MDKKYCIIGITVIVLAIAVYSGGGTKNLLDDIKKLTSPDSENKNIGDSKNPNDAVLDKIVQKLLKEGIPENRTLVKSSAGSGGSGGSGAESSCKSAASFEGISDYYVKARLQSMENVVDPESGEMITYTYALVDEYQKGNDTDPNINPGELLIVSITEGTSQQGTQVFNEPEFTYMQLTRENWDYYTVC